MKSRRKSPPDFRGKKTSNSESYYDIELDAVLIEQSIAKQYGVLPSVQPELPYWEWARLVSGLMDDTPLGRVVAVRSETDRERIKQFSPWQMQIRTEWQNHLAGKAKQTFDADQWRKDMADLERMLAAAFGGGT